MSVRIEDTLRNELLDRRWKLQGSAGNCCPPADVTRLMEQVDAALARMDQGTYGPCEVCNDPVESDRLLADPLERFCLDHLPPAEARALEADIALAAQVQRNLGFENYFGAKQGEIILSARLSIWERLTSMKNKVLTVLAVALLTSITALWASDSAGRWFARIPDEGTVLKRFVELVGPQTVFTFRVDGTELLGTVSYPPGEEAPIKNGKINGDQISFVVIKEHGMRLVYKGIVAENEIKFTQDIQGENSPQEFIAEREFQRNGDVPLRIQKPGKKSP